MFYQRSSLPPNPLMMSDRRLGDISSFGSQSGVGVQSGTRMVPFFFGVQKIGTAKPSPFWLTMQLRNGIHLMQAFSVMIRSTGILSTLKPRPSQLPQ